MSELALTRRRKRRPPNRRERIAILIVVTCCYGLFANVIAEADPTLWLKAVATATIPGDTFLIWWFWPVVYHYIVHGYDDE